MHIVVTGMGRGGTSIVGQVLGLHPSATLRHEKSCHWLANHTALSAMGRLLPEHATPQVAAKLQGWAKEPSKVLVDKDPRWVQRLGFLRAACPGARIIYMVRDPRDLVCSAWNGIRKKRRSMDNWLAQRDKKVADELRAFPARLALLGWWNHAVWTDLADMQGDPLFRIVKYESVLADPVGMFAGLLHWMGLGLDSKVEAFLANVSDDPSVHVSPLSAANFVKGHPRRVGRWRREWPADEAHEALSIAGTLIRGFGYPEE